MILEWSVLYISSIIAIFSIFYIPKNKRLQAQFLFLFIQFPTWMLGLSAVELHLLEYPYRELSKINRTSFIFEYLILPVLCIHFNAHFPKHATKLVKVGLYIGTSLSLTVVEIFLERYTDVIKYTGWDWYWTFLSVLFILWLSRIASLYFFRND